ncbi:hypothetical protein Q31b_35580 [Novipirellula aureliae]|uniref:Uncharacterized protein n=1 Tax=Novipirellula aureliae TaxID=2527966 RepID=A0A5C6DSA9_9BACT|nr:hypothetical protein Q31b_35580 [Novipirellula aureliae]
MNIAQFGSQLIRQPIERLAVSQPYRVIIFSRFPEPGLTKTRMIPALGPERAAQLQQALTTPRRVVNRNTDTQ